MQRRVAGLATLLVLTLGPAGCGSQLSHKAIVDASVERVGSVRAAEPGAATGPAAVDGTSTEAGGGLPAAAGGEATGTASGGIGPSGSGSASGAAAGSGATGSGAAGGTVTGAAGRTGPSAAGKSATTTGGGRNTSTGGPAPTPGPATGPAGSATPTADHSPFIIGSVGTQGGIVGASVADGTKALRAWAAQVNAKGGLAGHPVNLIVADDGSDPARHQALVQQLVEERGVIAFVYNSAPLSGQASVKYLTDKRVPVIGSELAGQWFYESPMFFPQASSGLALVYNSIAGVATHVVPQGKTKVAFLNCQEAQYCTDADRIWPQIAGQFGFTVVSRARASLAQPDFSAECLGAKNAGAQVLIMAMDSNSVGRVAASCARADFHPVFSWASTVTLDRHKDDPNLEGSVIPVPLEPWFLTDKPVVKEFQDALGRYAAGVLPSGSSENGWVAGKLFEKAAAGITGKPTSDAVLAGLWSLRGDNLSGFTYPITFTRDQKATQVNCWYTVVIGKNAFTSPDDGQIHCKN
jgi:branched-chain amino acid transport system substrate-binding protein